VYAFEHIFVLVLYGESSYNAVKQQHVTFGTNLVIV